MKSPAPMMSLNPSGSIFGLLTASRWKGRPYLRGLVTPSNPSSAGQITARKYLGSIAKAARAVLTQFNDTLGVGSQFYLDARDLAPTGQSWISFMQRFAKDIYDKTITNWALIDATEKGYFTSGATTLGLSDYSPVLGGVTQTGLTAGQQVMALAFFARDYLAHPLTALLSTGPVAGDVTAFVTYVQTSV
jgi:hypothetical protein